MAATWIPQRVEGEAGDTGNHLLVPMLGRRNDSDAVRAASDGGYTSLSTDSSGRLKVIVSAGAITITPSGTQDVNLTKVGGSTFALGQQLAAASLPVVLTAAQISTLTPLSTVAVTQSTSPWVTTAVGTVAHDGVGTAVAPLLMGGYASAAAPTDVNLDGDAVRAWRLRNGAAACVLTAAGALIGGDAANGLDVDVTRLPSLVAGAAIIGKVGIDQTTPGTTNLVALTAETTKVIGTVNQGTSPWVVSGTVTTTPGGTQTVAGNKTNNNAAPGATNVGALVAIANAAAPSWTEGNEVLLSTDLSGGVRLAAETTKVIGTINVAAGQTIAVTNAGTFVVQATLAAETTKVIGTVNVAAGQTIAVTNAGTFVVQATLAAETTKVIGVVRNADGSGNLLTSTSNALDVNLKTSSITLAVSLATNTPSGSVAHDGVGTGVNPLLMGGYASAATPLDVNADGDAVRSWHLRNGAQATVLTAAGALIGGDATNGLDVDVTRMSALVAGAAIIGKVGIDQTTPGTTNLVALTAETTKVIGTVNIAAGQSIAVTNAGTFAVQAAITAASGSIASGAIAAGAIASGAAVSGAFADGAIVTLGLKTDAKSTATDGTSITIMSVLKQISASAQAPPSQAVTNAGTFAVQAAITAASGAIASGAVASGAIAAGAIASGAAVAGSFADGAIVTLGLKTDAKSTATDATSVTIMQVLKEISAMAQAPAALPANQSVNVAQINGVTPLMGTGIMGTGSPRVTIASDQTAVTTAGVFSVKLDQTTPGTTNAVSLAQIGANTVSSGNGASGTGVLRVAQVSDGTGRLATLDTVTLVSSVTTTVIGGQGENADIDTAAEQITTSSVAAKFGVRVMANPTNSGIIYIGTSAVTADSADATDGYPLYAGDSIFLPVNNANLVYAIASVNNQALRWIAV